MSDTTDQPPRPAMPVAVMVWGAIIASTIILAGYVVAIVLLFFYELPDGSQQQAASMFSTLQTLATLAAGFWLGSSVGSMQKTAGTKVGP